MNIVNKYKKNTFFLVFILLTSQLMSFYGITAQFDNPLVDPLDDVTKMDIFDFEPTITDEYPNIDIQEVSYALDEHGKNATVTLMVNNRGKIEDIDTLNMGNMNGKMVEYGIDIQTNKNDYQFIYSNKSCESNDQVFSYFVSDANLTIRFPLKTENESVINISSQTTAIVMDSMKKSELYMDFTPDKYEFNVYISGPAEGYVGEELHFSANIKEIIGVSPYYTFSWNISDGNTYVGREIDHVFDDPGAFSIEVTGENHNGDRAKKSMNISIIQDMHPPVVEILKPDVGAYVENKKIGNLSFEKPFIFGPIDITVDAFDSESGIEKVDFFINDELKYSDKSEPYHYYWALEHRALFDHTNTIKVIAFDKSGKSTKEELPVWRFYRDEDSLKSFTYYFKDTFSNTSNSDLPLLSNRIPSKRFPCQYPPKLFTKTPSRLLPGVTLNEDEYGKWIIDFFVYQFINSDQEEYEDLFEKFEILLPHPLRIAQIYENQDNSTQRITGDIGFDLYFSNQEAMNYFKFNTIELSLYLYKPSSLPKKIANKSLILKNPLCKSIVHQKYLIKDVNFTLAAGENLIFSIEIKPYEKRLNQIISNYIDNEYVINWLQKRAERWSNSIFYKIHELGQLANLIIELMQENSEMVTSSTVNNFLNILHSPRLLYDSLHYPSSVLIPFKE